MQNYLTVNGNTQYISKRRLKRAQDVKRLQNALRMPSYKALKAIITMNVIKDNQISHDDINLAETIFGKSTGEIKGKTIRQNKKYEDTETINIPEERIYKNKNLELSIDTMYVNRLLFLTSLSRKLFYRTAQYIPSKNKKNFIKCMEEIITIFKFGEFNIKSIHCDQEFSHFLQDFANKNKIKLICAPSQAHVPCAERNILTIKERVRSLFHDLLYRGIPKTIMKYPILQTTATINYFPAQY